MTLKKAIMRGLLGFPMGVCIGFAVTIIISLLLGTGSFYPVQLGLITSMGSEIGAVIFQFVMTGVLGAGTAMGSSIFAIESWSLGKQTIVHFSLSAVLLLMIAFLCQWLPMRGLSTLIFIGIYLLEYLAIWCIQYFIWKRKIQALNQRLHS